MLLTPSRLPPLVPKTHPVLCFVSNIITHICPNSGSGWHAAILKFPTISAHSSRIHISSTFYLKWKLPLLIAAWSERDGFIVLPPEPICLVIGDFLIPSNQLATETTQASSSYCWLNGSTGTNVHRILLFYEHFHNISRGLSLPMDHFAFCGRYNEILDEPEIEPIIHRVVSLNNRVLTALTIERLCLTTQAN